MTDWTTAVIALMTAWTTKAIASTIGSIVGLIERLMPVAMVFQIDWIERVIASIDDWTKRVTGSIDDWITGVTGLIDAWTKKATASIVVWAIVAIELTDVMINAASELIVDETTKRYRPMR